jgi:hypothetical protein
VHDRHSIENLVFDPLLLAVFLLREQLISAPEVGLPSQVRHFELGAAHAQPIVDALGRRLGISGATVPCAYRGGFSVDMPETFLEQRGHELESLLVVQFPGLKRHQGRLKREVVKRAMGDVPDYTPESVLTLFGKLLSG